MTPIRNEYLSHAIPYGSAIDFQNNLFKLSADIQKTIVSSWSSERLSECEIPGLFKSIKLIEKESLGVMPMVSGIKAVPVGRSGLRKFG